tara:strand:+ start:282 stop:587 length:306 start_codon:yes stop_codon:yes gene_type:complete
MKSKYCLAHSVWNPPRQQYIYYSPLGETDSLKEILNLAKNYTKKARECPLGCDLNGLETRQRPHTIIALLKHDEKSDKDIFIKQWYLSNTELHKGKVEAIA